VVRNTTSDTPNRIRIARSARRRMNRTMDDRDVSRGPPQRLRGEEQATAR
jgi:hypothetical protein